MKFLKTLTASRSDASAAFGIDWSVMTSTILGFGQVVMTVVGSSVTGLGDAIVVDQHQHNAS